MKRERQVKFCLTEDEYNRLLFLCARGERNKGDVLRFLINDSALSLGYDHSSFTPKTSTKEQHRIMLRLSDEEFHAVVQGQQQNLFATMSRYLISIIRNATYGLSFLAEVELVEMQKTRNEIRRIGRNVNQIALCLYEQSPANSAEIIREVRDTQKIIMQSADKVNDFLNRATNRHFLNYEG